MKLKVYPVQCKYFSVYVLAAAVVSLTAFPEPRSAPPTRRHVSPTARRSESHLDSITLGDASSRSLAA
ncbi:hypothetical protein EYF80_048654 [Liparis tanakae]|uniref:Uncharacterized protein n=1 Tax=Liparis tanakae TaxID=230148 RepID=A0A4Z2FK79_9TELE|nr:hypothetical protein EYF80_048654 [Liparis tanakae]